MESSQQPLRVLVVGPSFDGGVSNYVEKLIQHSNSAQVQFESVKIGRRSPASPFWYRPFEYLSGFWDFSRRLFQSRPDLVHLNPSLNWGSLPLNILFLALTRFVGRRPVIVFFRGWEDVIAMAMVRRTLVGSILRRFLFWADYYLVMASQFKEQLIQAGFPESKIAVSSVMVDVAQFDRPLISSVEVSRADKDKALQVLFLSRLVPAKGMWVLIDALNWWQQQHPDCIIHMTIAGDGPEKEKLEDYIVRRNLQQMISLPGYLCGEEKIRSFQNADLFVFPSRHPEGFPNAILEALGAGLPVIYTPIGALQEVLSSENGIRLEVDALSGETLGSSIWELYQDPTRRHLMAEANRRLAREKFDAALVCAKMATIYQQVLNGGI